MKKYFFGLILLAASSSFASDVCIVNWRNTPSPTVITITCADTRQSYAVTEVNNSLSDFDMAKVLKGLTDEGYKIVSQSAPGQYTLQK